MGTLTINFTPSTSGACSSYRVKYRVGTGAYTTVSPEPTGSPVTITGIDTTLAYNGTVESDCGSGFSVIANWTAPAILSSANCPTPTLTTTPTTVAFSFSHSPTPGLTYTMDLLDSGGLVLSPAQSISLAGTTTPTMTGTFSGLTASTNYNFRVSIYNGHSTIVCSNISVSTSSCNPPTSISASLSDALS